MADILASLGLDDSDSDSSQDSVASRPVQQHLQCTCNTLKVVQDALKCS